MIHFSYFIYRIVAHYLIIMALGMILGQKDGVSAKCKQLLCFDFSAVIVTFHYCWTTLRASYTLAADIDSSIVHAVVISLSPRHVL